MAINDKNHPALHKETLTPGKSVALCRCWQSGAFPYCWSQLTNDGVVISGRLVLPEPKRGQPLADSLFEQAQEWVVQAA